MTGELSRNGEFGSRQSKRKVFSSREDRHAIPFMICALLSAAVNLGFLIKESLDAEMQISGEMEYILIFFSVGVYFFVGGGLELLARKQLGPISRQLNEIRARRN
jgi:hypothetical protein